MAGLEDLTLLQNAARLADENWQLVQSWNEFARDTLGKQWVRSTDSVGANVAESFGRFHYGEKINFLYYARGSVFESKYWLNRARARDLVSEELFQAYAQQLTDIAVQINNFVRSLKKQRTAQRKSNTLRESEPVYLIADDTESDDDFDADLLPQLP